MRLNYDAVMATFAPDSRSARELDRAKQYVFTPEAFQVVLEAAERMGNEIITPTLPVSPMWVEISGMMVINPLEQHATAAWNILGMILEQHGEVIGLYGFRQGPISIENFGIGMASQSKEWRMTLVHGAYCPYQCELPQQADYLDRDGETLTFDDLNPFCGACWHANVASSLRSIVATLLYMLSARGVEIVETTRLVRQPRERSGKTKAVEMPYKRISLSTPDRIYRVHDVDTVESDHDNLNATAHEDEGNATYREVRNRAHVRLLLPAPGKPWKEAQIVQVAQSKPYQRRVTSLPVHYIVTP
jgi:hypothetical protein